MCLKYIYIPLLSFQQSLVSLWQLPFLISLFFVFYLCPIVGSRQIIVGCRQTIVGCRQTIIGCRQAVVGSRQAIVGCRQAIGGSRQTTGGCRRAIGGSRQAIGGSVETHQQNKHTIHFYNTFHLFNNHLKQLT